jgi:hypothetical protein
MVEYVIVNVVTVMYKVDDITLGSYDSMFQACTVEARITNRRIANM